MGDQEYKQAHRKAGLCVECSWTAYPGHTRCLTHIRSHTRREKLRREKLGEIYLRNERDRKELRRQRGLCVMCGGPLEDDSKFINCQNCRERIFFERVENAITIV